MNAPAPLAISTYDGSNQTVHPDVLFVPGGIGGFEYWMATTPYPYCRDRIENPSIRASHDGSTWVLPTGAPDPVVDAPADPEEHHADPDIVFADGMIHLIFMTTNEKNRATRFSVVRSVDGRSWSAPTVIYAEPFGVSPTVVVRVRRWSLWYVNYDSDRGAKNSNLMLRAGESLESLGGPRECTLNIPGYVLWHVDIIAVGDGFEALVAAFPRGSTSSRCHLFHATSDDGVAFRLTSSTPLLRPSRFGWDNRVIYRSCFLKDQASGSYRVWYTGGSWARTWGIGYLEGTLRGLAPHSRAVTQSRADTAAADVLGLARYLSGRILPKGIVRLARGIIDR